jgi:ubiquinone/menaquinone biosynthesis C-methylase UbiE
MIDTATISEPQSRTAIIKETFNTIADVYDSPALRFFQTSAEHLAASLGLRGNERVIDIATGTGNAALALSSHLPHGTVTGIDFSAAMLAQARQKAGARGAGNVEFIEMDMQEIAPGFGGYDVATCAFGIFFVEEMESQLQRITQLVRPGGCVATCNFHLEYFNPLRTLMVERLIAYGVQIPPQTWRRIASEEGCRELFARAGLGNVTVELKNMGYYLADAEQWWELIWSAGFRGMLKQLAPEALERFREEHLAEVAALATPDGIWLDVGVYFTRGMVG